LAAADHDFVLTEPASKRQRLREKLLAASRRGSRRTVRWGRCYLSTLAIGLFIATAAAILLNALVWQRTRHPAPLFSRVVPAVPRKKPMIAGLIAVPLPRPQPALAPVQAQDEPVEKPAAQISPVEMPPLEIPAHGHPRQTRSASSPPHDVISEAATSAARSKLVLAAQRALVKLGFVLDPDGVVGPTTRRAVERYERDHGLPVSGELTPALTRRLTAEAGISKK
jgi:hypothetical protein